MVNIQIESVALIIALLMIVGCTQQQPMAQSGEKIDEEYNPQINPADFSSNINNPYFNYPTGKKFVYSVELADRQEKIEIEVLKETKIIMGVETRVFLEKVRVAGELVEETRNFIAQDKEGNVWYFGEESKQYELLELVGTEGSWIAGVNAAKPGMLIKGTLTVGDEFREEFTPGKDEGKRKVVKTGIPVTTEFGAYQDCVQFYDWTPLDDKSKENKFFCKEVGGLVLSEHLVETEKKQLLSIKGSNTNNDPLMIEQPTKEEIGDLNIAPESKRVDMKIPTFSNPTNINNPLFPVKLPQVLLTGHIDGEPQQVTYSTLPTTRKIKWGDKEIETVVIQYNAYLDRRIIESATDWYAQDDSGAVWYFGEDVYNYVEGEIVDRHGTWLTDKDGPPALIMPGNPKLGDVFRVENIPGIAFEEITVTDVGAEIDGSFGKIKGVLIGSQLHMDNTYSDKSFVPGIGEYVTATPSDLEVVALALPADALPGPVPDELRAITSGALKIFYFAGEEKWAEAKDALKQINKEWVIFNSKGKNSHLLVAQMNRALVKLEGDAIAPAVGLEDVAGARLNAVDTALASLDMELRYRSVESVDWDRLKVWARKAIVDAEASEPGFLLSDVIGLEMIQERLTQIPQTSNVSALVKNLREAAENEDFEVAIKVANELEAIDTLTTKDVPIATNYNPQINPADFTTKITNRYFTLPVGKKMTYRAETEDGVERIELEMEAATKMILGVETLVYRDRVYLGQELVEDTKDYLAQDKEGNVWYFGEDVNNYENGKLKDHAGSWVAGVNGAKPGIWIKALHDVGDSYKQEYYAGEAEDMRNVVAVNQTVSIASATYNGCVKMYDWTPLDPKSREHKYYCPEVGALVLNENLETGKRAELIKVQQP